MNLTTALWHLLNFFLPAVVMAGVFTLSTPLIWRKRPVRMRRRTQFALLLLVCVAILLGGLVFFGVDGKMATYVALVLGAGSVQWCLLRGWRA